MNTLRDLFLPTEVNGMTPRLLRPAAFGIYFIIAGCLIFSPRYLTLTDLALLAKPASYTARDMVTLTNAARAAVGLPALTENTLLTAAAEQKLDDMLENQYFAHVSPALQKKPWDFFKDAGYRYSHAGENLAKDFLAAPAAQDAFMNSPTHRANIVNPNYTEVGIAVGQGAFEGRTTILVAVYFGKPFAAPRAQAAAKPAAPQETKPLPEPVPAPAPESPSTTLAVLGTESENDPPAGDPIAAAARMVAENGWARAIALLAAFIVLVPLAALLFATRSFTVHTALPAALVILLFVSIAVFGVRYIGPERITPQAFAEIVR